MSEYVRVHGDMINGVVIFLEIVELAWFRMMVIRMSLSGLVYLV